MKKCMRVILVLLVSAAFVRAQDTRSQKLTPEELGKMSAEQIRELWRKTPEMLAEGFAKMDKDQRAQFIRKVAEIYGEMGEQQRKTAVKMLMDEMDPKYREAFEKLIENYQMKLEARSERNPATPAGTPAGKGPDPGAVGSGNPQGHETAEIAFGVAVLMFGVIIILAVVYLMVRHQRYWDRWSAQIVILTLIITSGTFLITAGFSQQQIAPMVGLLGTVAGYLLGQQGRRSGRSKEIVPSSSPAPPSRPTASGKGKKIPPAVGPQGN